MSITCVERSPRLLCCSCYRFAAVRNHYIGNLRDNTGCPWGFTTESQRRPNPTLQPTKQGERFLCDSVSLCLCGEWFSVREIPLLGKSQDQRPPAAGDAHIFSS